MLVALGALAAGVLGAPRVEACSRAEWALSPSNFESVMLADAVVLARTEAVEPVEGAPYPEFRARFAVLEEIAGARVGTSLELFAIGIAPERSPADSFLISRPSGNCSSCVCGYGFAPGQLYVLLLERNEQGWSIGGLMAMRAAEQVDDARAPWAVAVREYARIALDPDSRARRSALVALRERAARGDEPELAPAALVEDLDNHFSTPHATKSFEELVAIYGAAGDESDARSALWALAHQEDGRVDGFFGRLLDDALRGDLPPARGDASRLIPIADRARRLQQLEPVEKLVTLFPRLGATASSTRHTIARSLHEVCARAPRSWVLAVALEANDEELAALGGRFEGDLCLPAVAEARRRVGEDYATAYYGLRALLARAGDAGAARWADDRIDAGDDEESSAVYYLAISPGPEAEAAIRRRIEEGDDRFLAVLVPVLFSENVVDRDERLAAVAARLATATGPYPRLGAALADWHWQHPDRTGPLLQALESSTPTAPEP